MEMFLRRIANLITIKSLVTLTLTIVFSVLSLRGVISSEMFLSIFSMVVAFYFGTVTKRNEDNGTE